MAGHKWIFVAVIILALMVPPYVTNAQAPLKSPPIFPEDLQETENTGILPFAFLKDPQKNKLKSALITATLRAVEMEIQLYEGRLQSALSNQENQEKVSMLERKIAELKYEFAKTTQITPSTYMLPKRKQVNIIVTKPYNYGTLLEFTNSAGSCPFYYIAGIQGDDFSLLEVRNRYVLTLYLLRPRDYDPLYATSFYVYVMAPAPQSPGFSAPDFEGPPQAFTQ